MPSGQSRRGEFIYCSGLTSTTLGNRPEDIGDNAFHSCTPMEGIVILDAVRTIRSKVFSYCLGLMAVTLGDDDGNSYSEGDNDIGSDNDGDH